MKDDKPVFLDPIHPGANDKDPTIVVDKESCMLYTINPQTGTKQYLSNKPFMNVALYMAGGETFMIDNPNQLQQFRFLDQPKSLLFKMFTSSTATNTNEDSKMNTSTNSNIVNKGERIRDIVPAAGTLVMFDSVTLPHQVLTTNRERYGVQGWFHETLYNYSTKSPATTTSNEIA